MKLITLSEKEFNDFSKNHELTSFYQTSMYGNSCKNDFSTHYIGIIDDNKLIGASLILYKKIFMNFKYAYAPRGILIDYTNKALLKDFTIKFKHLLLKQGFIFIKIDPLIIINKRDNRGNIILSNRNNKNIMNNFINAGYIYRGNTKYFENLKSRFETYINLNNSELSFLGFKKNHKNRIRRALKYGVEVHEDKDKNINKSYDIIKRKYRKNKDFYDNLINNFKDNIKIYNIYINPETSVINSKYLYEKELEKNEQINSLVSKHKGKNVNKLISKKMDSDILLNNYKKILVSSTKLLESNPKGFLIGTSIIILYNNKVYLLIESFDKKYSNFYPTYLLKWRIIEEYTKLNYKEFNLNAITGDFTKENKYSGLNEMKLGFNGEINEYIGEFDYIINRPIYYLFITVERIFKIFKKN